MAASGEHLATVIIASHHSDMTHRWKQHLTNSDGSNAVGSNGKGILVMTSWRSSIAVSFAFFLLNSYTLLHSIENEIPDMSTLS